MGTTGSSQSVWEKPDPARYTLDKAPNLAQLQERLQREGLRDPWLRNHVWKFMGPHKEINLMHIIKAPYHGVFRGIKYGVIAVALYIGVDQIINRNNKDDGHDGHH